MSPRASLKVYGLIKSHAVRGGPGASEQAGISSATENNGKKNGIVKKTSKGV